MSHIIPSLICTEVFFPLMDKKGFVAGIIEKFADEGFYRSFEIGTGYDKEDRKRIRSAKEKYNVSVTQWLTYLTYETRYDVSSVDPLLRRETVNEIKNSLYLAAETGVSNVSFVPGPDPGEQLRGQATEAFYESVCEICEEASKYNISLAFESFDREAHKKRLIGPTVEAVDFINRVREKYPDFGLAFDTSHVSLLGEGIEESLELARDVIHQFHFANAVTDPTSELYGDFHIPIGNPGFLTVEKMKSVLQKIDQLGIQSEKGLPVALEVRGTDENNYLANEVSIRNALERALSLVESN
ncbi:sugar phosphate isomerase/epimerase family protein [Heyndrickxia faecalis]|uniref:sugar phosphate isomerase/epimerase family protein n=1 Tax=Heyndrickxia faecalis TaxID=2824910 RepID=UPI003D261080